MKPLLLIAPAGSCKVKSRALTSSVFLEPLVIVMVEQAVGPRVASPAATGVALTLMPSSSIVSPAFPTTSPLCFPGKLSAESDFSASFAASCCWGLGAAAESWPAVA